MSAPGEKILIAHASSILKKGLEFKKRNDEGFSQKKRKKYHREIMRAGGGGGQRRSIQGASVT